MKQKICPSATAPGALDSGNRNLQVEPGERVALFAPSGYGKTTLAMLLAGYLKPTRGEVLLDGSPLPKTGVCPVQLITSTRRKPSIPAGGWEGAGGERTAGRRGAGGLRH